MSRKKRRARLIQSAETHPVWALGCAADVGGSRLAQPQLPSWIPGGQDWRLVEKATAPDELEPTALACYGFLLRAAAPTPEQRWWRLTRRPPGRGITVQFLQWGSAHRAALGKQAFLLVWDNASWHRSQDVQRGLRPHNQQVKQTRQGVRLVSCRVPSNSPWLNPIEPNWVHGKRAIVELERVLTAAEVEARVYA